MVHRQINLTRLFIKEAKMLDFKVILRLEENMKLKKTQQLLEKNVLGKCG